MLTVQQLASKQVALGMKDPAFAGFLGVPRSTWQLTRSGRKRLGRRIALAVINNLPDLRGEAISFLTSNVTTGAADKTTAA